MVPMMHLAMAPDYGRSKQKQQMVSRRQRGREAKERERWRATKLPAARDDVGTPTMRF